MFNIAAWNVRGLNDPGREVECRSFISNNRVALMVFIETHVKLANSVSIMKKIRPAWGWAHNYDVAYNGRLWVGWDKEVIDVRVIKIHVQMMHIEVTSLSDHMNFFCSAIYAYNFDTQRCSLWEQLRSLNVQGSWILLGDFNTVLIQEERIQGGDVVESDTRELQT